MARTGTLNTATRGLISTAHRRGGAFALRPANRTAAASALTRLGDFKGGGKKKTGGWQADALTYYETLPPVGFVLDFKANTVAACDFNVTKDDEPVENDEQIDRLMSSLVGPRGGTYEVFKRAALLVEITGEAYFVGTPVADESEAVWWEFLSVEEIILPDQSVTGVAGSGFKRDTGSGEKQELPVDAHIARFWRADARKSWLPHCGLRRCLSTCRELVLLGQMTEAVISSRLPMGLLLLPDTMQHLSPLHRQDAAASDADDEVGEGDDFMADFLAHLSDPISDFGSASTFVPLVIQANREDLAAIKMVDLARDLDQYAAGLREEMYGRLAVGMDVPPEIINGKGGLNHWCVDDTTEILTADRGWITHADLAEGDIVLTLNHDTGLAQWQPVTTVARFQVQDLEMVAIEGLTHSSLTTPNHRWPTMHRLRRNLVGPDGRPTSQAAGVDRHWTTSEKLNTNDALVTAAPNVDLPVDQKWSDAFVETVAWFWTEGACRYRKGRLAPQVAITQSHVVNGENVARIRRALTALYGPATDGPMSRGGRGAASRDDTPRWREVQRGRNTEFYLNVAAAAPIVDVAPDRVVDLDFVHQLTAAQLELFVDVSIRADGTVLPAGTCQLAQNKPERLDALELAAVLTGRSTHIYPITSGRCPMWMLSFSDRETYGIHKQNVTVESYSGTVWCPTTPNRTWFARRNGHTYFTGNTGFNVDNDFLFKHVRPVGNLIADFLTYAYLRPMLIAEGMSIEEAASFDIVFDASPLANNENDDQKARDLWDNLLISDRAVVEKQGWDPASVMPDDDERTRRLVEKMVLNKVVSLSDEGAKFLGLDPAWFAVADPRRTPPSEFGEPPVETIPGVGPVPAQGGDDPVAPQQPGAPKAPPTETPGSTGRQGGPKPQTAASAEVLVALIGARADAAYDRAMEIAGNRILNNAKKVAAYRDRFAGVEPDQIPSRCTPVDLGAVGLTVSACVAGAWRHLGDHTHRLLAERIAATGMAPAAATQAAAAITCQLVADLDGWLAAEFHTHGRIVNGFKVPIGLVVAAVDQASRPAVRVA